MADLETLQTVFGQATGLWEFPTTRIVPNGQSEYCQIKKVIRINEKNAYEAFEFFWLHEAKHHEQYVNGMYDYDDNALRAKYKKDVVLYYCLPLERDANLFAYRLCIANGWAIPNHLPEGYFEYI